MCSLVLWEHLLEHLVIDVLVGVKHALQLVMIDHILALEQHLPADGVVSTGIAGRPRGVLIEQRADRRAPVAPPAFVRYPHR